MRETKRRKGGAYAHVGAHDRDNFDDDDDGHDDVRNGNYDTAQHIELTRSFSPTDHENHEDQHHHDHDPSEFSIDEFDDDDDGDENHGDPSCLSTTNPVYLFNGRGRIRIRIRIRAPISRV